MDKEEQLLTTDNPKEKEIETLIQGEKQELKTADLSQANQHPLDAIFQQRKEQRDKVLSSITDLLWASFCLLAFLLYIQTIGRIAISPTFSVVDNVVFQVLSVSVFGQIIGVVFIISRSLWDDKNYMDLFK